MSNEIRFMNEIFRIVGGALRLDTDKVRNYTAFLADKLESAGEATSATRLRKMLEETDRQLRPAGISSNRALPVDSESRFSLVERVNLRGLHDQPMVLPEEAWEVVHEFVSVAKSSALIEAEGTLSSLSLLLYGPPGSGKSHLARHIARDLGIELFVARLDGLISSYLGSTSKNIRALFEFAAKQPCVLFLDEFDALAKVRGDAQELGELKRVVNSFIQNLDNLGPHCIVIAATNHDELLDAAVWRRFSYRLKLDYPSAPLRQQMWSSLVTDLQFTQREMDVLVDLSEGFSGSDLKEVTTRLQRKRIVTREHPQLRDAFFALQNLSQGEGAERRFLSELAGKSTQDISAALRVRNSKLYSHSVLAELFNISKATAHRLATAGGKHDA
jgi:SpoVK/Ycf46/Vps4 family AAA+-type ATPase